MGISSRDAFLRGLWEKQNILSTFFFFVDSLAPFVHFHKENGFPLTRKPWVGTDFLGVSKTSVCSTKYQKFSRKSFFTQELLFYMGAQQVRRVFAFFCFCSNSYPPVQGGFEFGEGLTQYQL